MTAIVVPVETPTMLGHEQLFQAAVGTYNIAFDDLVERIARGEVTGANAKEAFATLHVVEKGAFENLKTWLNEHKHGTVVRQYIYAATTFANYLADAANAKADPFKAPHRRNTKKHFEVWKAAERNYSNLGYRTVALDNWLLPLVDSGNLYSSFITLMMQVRPRDEEVVLHALIMQKKNPSLKI